MPMPLAEYRRKRRFSRSPEPQGKRNRAAPQSRFVVQKHAASTLHYDFRLELAGVLKSWAVPKGPSFDPSEKRLAVQVEDHPLEYADFEGAIPSGEYGAGNVIVWDRGDWEPEGDPKEGYRNGRLNFTLHGEKLHGGWSLIRMAPRRKQKAINWLLIKRHDDDARPQADYDVLTAEP
ncbi:MAG TPA: DNA polymerase ligase N-terminal domain-containing protein, partial [Pirellulales bacterium]|nr:DNA polymerase ligase N-terminal domain-containing protein [Pirellulales bacterium]